MRRSFWILEPLRKFQLDKFWGARRGAQPSMSLLGCWYGRVFTPLDIIPPTVDPCPSMTPSIDGRPKGPARKSWYVDPAHLHLLKKLNSISRPPQLVNKDTNETVAESHSQRRSSIFRKPRDMSLEISQTVSHAVDIVLLTFILVWRERRREERAPNLGESISMAVDHQIERVNRQ